MKEKNKNSLKQAIFDVVYYYAYFEYAPTGEEIQLFLSVPATRPQLQKILQGSIKNGILFGENGKYTLGGHSIFIKSSITKKKTSEHKIKAISIYSRLVSIIAPVRLLGLSGSIAMMDADVDDDVDLFVVAKSGRMWTTRFVCILLALIMGLRRKRTDKYAPDKVCLNLFFDERELSVPDHKRNAYTAHEVLQMKPIVNKNHTHEKFLEANKWVQDYFPNAIRLDATFFGRFTPRVNPSEPSKRASSPQSSIFNLLSLIFYPLSSFVENILQSLQLRLINRHKTTEIITPTQLWFFPHDFEEKLRKGKRI